MPQDSPSVTQKPTNANSNTSEAIATSSGRTPVRGLHYGACIQRCAPPVENGTSDGKNACCMVNGPVPSVSMGKQNGHVRWFARRAGRNRRLTGKSKPDRIKCDNVPANDSVKSAADLQMGDVGQVKVLNGLEPVTPKQNVCDLKAPPKRKWYKNKRCKVSCTVPPQQSPEAEDWEKDLQDVTLSDWEQMTFGTLHYGPEDVISFAMRNVALCQMHPPIPPLTANYRPDRHHPRRLEISNCNVPTEPGQFSDADE